MNTIQATNKPSFNEWMEHIRKEIKKNTEVKFNIKDNGRRTETTTILRTN